MVAEACAQGSRNVVVACDKYAENTWSAWSFSLIASCASGCRRRSKPKGEGQTDEVLCPQDHSIQHRIQLRMPSHSTFEITQSILISSSVVEQIIHFRNIPPSSQQWHLPVFPLPWYFLDLTGAEVLELNGNRTFATLRLDERATLARHPDATFLSSDCPYERSSSGKGRASLEVGDERGSFGNHIGGSKCPMDRHEIGHI